MRKQLWWLGFSIIPRPFAGIHWFKIYKRGECNDHDWIRTIMCDFHWAFFFQDRAQWYHWLCGAFAF